MQTKLIQIKDYLLLIDEEAEIQKGDLKICLNDNYISKYLSKQNIESDTKCSDCKKIIAYRKLNEKAKELDLPLLPPFEEVNSALNNYISSYKSKFDPDRDIYAKGIKTGFIAGYKAAQQSNKQFSLEDMKKAIEMAREQSEPYYGGGGLVLSEPIYEDKHTEEEIIQSLSSQQLPKEFIPEYNLMNKGYDKPEDFPYQECKVFKTITNSEGKQELVGTYKY